MRAQARQLEDLLRRDGWVVTARIVPTDSWWIDELWELTSVWRPEHSRAFISFVVDPQAPSTRRAGEHVWAIAIDKLPAASPTPGNAVPVKPSWESRKGDVVELISKLRRNTS